MELVSEMDRRSTIVEDNDIDLDLTGDQPEDDDDDYMIDDANSDTAQQLYGENPLQAGNDDVMLDEEDARLENEDTMPINDEDLGDGIIPTQEYKATSSEESYYEVILEHDPTSFGPDAETDEPAGATLMYGKDIISVQEEPPMQDILRAEALRQTDTPELEFATNVVAQADTNNVGEGYDSADKVHMKSNSDNSSAGITPPGVTEPQTEGALSEEVPGIPASRDNLGAPQNDGDFGSGVPLPSTLRVHPVVVVYQNNEISLFPPLEENQEPSQTFFVHDEKLAAQSISKLLEACRVVLDESIAEEEELEIRIEDLGLYINEGAAESHTTTLIQILDTYLQLQHQDGYENPDPLYLTLCTRIKFSHRLASLVTAAAAGKGLSQLHFWDSPENSDEVSDVQQGHNLTVARNTSNVNSPSAEAGAGSPAGQTRESENESTPSTSLEGGVSSPARHRFTVGSDAPNALEAVEHPGSEVPTTLTSTTGKQDAIDVNATDDTDHGEEQTISGLSSSKDHQTIQAPESPLLQAEPATENGDTIDYEYEENVDQEASVGSSTLQGDVSEAAAEETQMHHPFYTAHSNHGSLAEELLEEHSEVHYSLVKQPSTGGDMYQGEHSIAYSTEADVVDDDTLDAQIGAPNELTESEYDKHGEHQSDHQQKYQETVEDEEQLDLDQSLQDANTGLHTTDGDELTHHHDPIPSTFNIDEAYGHVNAILSSTAHSDEFADQGPLYHKQHFHEGSTGASAAEQVTEAEASEDELIEFQLPGVISLASPTVQSADRSHNVPALATDVDEITYEEEEIEEPIDKDAAPTDGTASLESSTAGGTLKRVRSPSEEGNALGTDLLVDPKRVRSG